MQREHDKDHETKSRPIVNISDITRIRLRPRIQKIYDMLTQVIEGYGTFYYNKHGNPLPHETVDKIMCLSLYRGIFTIASISTIKTQPQL